jgi:Sec-independent protein secretion pathway component TatC
VIAPTKNFAFLFIVAGLVMISVFFITASPFDITNLILGTIPLVLLFCFGFSIWKTRNRPGAEDKDREAREGED